MWPFGPQRPFRRRRGWLSSIVWTRESVFFHLGTLATSSICCGTVSHISFSTFHTAEAAKSKGIHNGETATCWRSDSATGQQHCVAVKCPPSAAIWPRPSTGWENFFNSSSKVRHTGLNLSELRPKLATEFFTFVQLHSHWGFLRVWKLFSDASGPQDFESCLAGRHADLRTHWNGQIPSPS